MLENEVFSYYGKTVKLKDSYKDLEGKGLFERFNEILGKDLDDYTVKYTEDMLEVMCKASTMSNKFFQYLFNEIGFNVRLTLDDYYFRKLISMMPTILDSRGLLSCYLILFKFLGITDMEMESEGYYEETGFDSHVGFDSARTFDASNENRFQYIMKLTGSEEFDATLLDSILSIITFNTPFYVSIVRIFYNGELVYLNNLANTYTEEEYTNVFYFEDKMTLDRYIN